MKLSRSFFIIILLASIELEAKQRELTLLDFRPLVNQVSCLGSMVGDPLESQRCVSWTQRESAGPALDRARGKLFVGGSDRLLHRFDIRTSKTQNLALSSNLVAQPIVHQDAVYFGLQDGTVLRVNSVDLSVVWKTSIDAEVESKIVLWKKQLFVLTGIGTIYALDTDSGEVNWLKKRKLPNTDMIRVRAAPLLYDDSRLGKTVVAVGHPSGAFHIYDAQTGEQTFEIMLGDLKIPFPDISADLHRASDLIFAASYNSGVFAIDPDTGTRLFSVVEKGITRLASDKNLVYAAGASKVIAFNQKNGKIRWRYTFEKGEPTRMIIKNGRIYFASDRGGLFVLDARTGREIQVLGSSLGFAGDLEFSTDMLYALSTAGYLYRMGVPRS